MFVFGSRVIVVGDNFVLLVRPRSMSLFASVYVRAFSSHACGIEHSRTNLPFSWFYRNYASPYWRISGNAEIFHPMDRVHVKFILDLPSLDSSVAFSAATSITTVGLNAPRYANPAFKFTLSPYLPLTMNKLNYHRSAHCHTRHLPGSIHTKMIHPRPQQAPGTRSDLPAL